MKKTAAHKRISPSAALNAPPSLTYYAIDGEETHSQYFDPDDAFTIESHDDGSSTIHVAIVDSTQISKQSSEYKRAARMGESKYAPTYNPMLSLDTNKRIGLKNGLNEALVTSIHLAPDGEILDTSFAHTSVQVTLLTHKQATQLLSDHSNEDLNALSRVANTLYGSREKRTHRIEYDARTGMRLGTEGTISYHSAQSYNVHKIVGEIMKLSNHATAAWADRSNLPFVFRNCVKTDDTQFDIGDMSRFEKNSPERESTRGKIIKLIQTPATFSATNRGHGHMNIDAYAFTTSPLRRYADLVNQKQQAYAIQIEETLADALATNIPASTAFHQFLWHELSNGLLPALVTLQHTHTLHDASAIPTISEQIHHLASRATEKGFALKPHSADDIATALTEHHLGYLPLDIAQIAEGLNSTLKQSEETKRSNSIDRMDRWLKKVIATPDSDILKAASKDDFTNLLERAAITGQMNQQLHDETVARLEAGGRLKPYKAYAGILFLAPNDEGEAGLWKNLKRRVLEDLRFNDKAMRQLAEMMADSSQKNNQAIGTMVFSDIELPDANGQPMRAAHYVLKVNDTILSPPSYTIMPEGHQAIAKSEALFNLVHNLAYKKLVPVHQVEMPNALSTSIHRIALPMDLLRAIAKEHHLSLSTTVKPSTRRGNEGCTARISLTLPKGETISESRFAANTTEDATNTITNTEDALRRASQRILRHPSVTPYLPADTYVDYSAPEDPLKALSEIATSNHLDIHFSEPESIIENHQLLYRVGLHIIEPKQRPPHHPQQCMYFQDHVNADSPERAQYVLAKHALETLREQHLLQETPQPETAEPTSWAKRYTRAKTHTATHFRK